MQNKLQTLATVRCVKDLDGWHVTIPTANRAVLDPKEVGKLQQGFSYIEDFLSNATCFTPETVKMIVEDTLREALPLHDLRITCTAPEEWRYEETSVELDITAQEEKKLNEKHIRWLFNGLSENIEVLANYEAEKGLYGAATDSRDCIAALMKDLDLYDEGDE